LVWSGLVVEVAADPRPPPNCPTITSDVGTEFDPVPVVKERLFVRLIKRFWPVGTVMTTGDQPAGVVAVASGAKGFSRAHVARVPLG
jgi:hypothetical protein